MKVTTDPQTGVTTCELHKQDRTHLAATKTLLSEIAYHERKTARGAEADSVAEFIGELLGGKTEEDAT